ncbi:LbetaH domain-containing protein [Cyclobacterium marinum]|uniref:Transferase, LpxA family n=1 Tax=Cyclobacterium marinum (strain ATCC 25205 / DSM 745 / LMG 13164 / NCIMB 1802) TaxID=880070 RepID=G0J5E3_CYCMS|nr:transferase [Cyclobacterium marinum]AEL27579.1 transferase, LpxA family [Cyclobacterium marinum DSM 745]
MIAIENYIQGFNILFPQCTNKLPWEIINELDSMIKKRFSELSSDYRVENNIAIHKTATLEKGVTIKGSVIISENCFIGANAYLRGPIFMAKSVKVGPGVEIKQSLIFENTALAHFNYIGNSVIGKNINFEAGSICANHYNEREDKTIYVKHNGVVINTRSKKFGALIGDKTKIGANAVLSPGTFLARKSTVKRLELVEQIK